MMWKFQNQGIILRGRLPIAWMSTTGVLYPYSVKYET